MCEDLLGSLLGWSPRPAPYDASPSASGPTSTSYSSPSRSELRLQTTEPLAKSLHRWHPPPPLLPVLCQPASPSSSKTPASPRPRKDPWRNYASGVGHLQCGPHRAKLFGSRWGPTAYLGQLGRQCCVLQVSLERYGQCSSTVPASGPFRIHMCRARSILDRMVGSALALGQAGFAQRGKIARGVYTCRQTVRCALRAHLSCNSAAGSTLAIVLLISASVRLCSARLQSQAPSNTKSRS